MTLGHSVRAATLGALAAFIFASTPATAAPSRSELDVRMQATEQLLREYRARIDQLESRLLTGDPAAQRLQERNDALEAQVSSLTGRLERLEFESAGMARELETLKRLLELRDSEIAEKLKLDPMTYVSEEEPVPGAPAPFGADIDAGGGWTAEDVSRFGQPTAPSNGPVPLGPPPGGSAAPTTGGFGAPAGLGATNPSPSGPSPTGSSSTGLSTTGPASSGSDPRDAVRGSLGSTVVAPIASDPTEALEEAKALLFNNNYDAAEVAFGQIETRFPDDAAAGEALFWRGETFFVRGDYVRAKDDYIAALQRFPSGPKAPDAMVKLAQTLTALNFTAEACQALDQFDRQHPSAAAGLKSKASVARRDAGCR